MEPDSTRGPSPVAWPTQPPHDAVTERRFVSRRLSLVLGGLAVVAVLAYGVPRLWGSGTTGQGQPTPSPQVTVTPSPPGRVVFQDSLATQNGNWGLNGVCSFGNGGLLVSGAGHCYAHVAPVADLTLQVTVRQVSGPSDQFFGIVLRSVDTSHYYQFGINGSQQWVFILWANGQPHDVVSPTSNSAIGSGQAASNTLQVQAQGSHFVFLVNGAQVGTADDGTYASGQVGLKTDWGSLVVVCNDYTVWVPA
jgi:hypothetical protein